MDLGIAGKTAVVTGGTNGIGRAIAEELGRNGCRVVVVARGQAGLVETVAAIIAEGGQAGSVSADLTEMDSYPRMVAEATALFDTPDIAIFSPVGPPPGRFDAMTDADFQTTYDNVVKAFAHFARAVVPAMKERKWGRIVTVEEPDRGERDEGRGRAAAAGRRAGWIRPWPPAGAARDARL